jgi:hypothetical protein
MPRGFGRSTLRIRTPLDIRILANAHNRAAIWMIGSKPNAICNARTSDAMQGLRKSIRDICG